jgi:hypothetical protein
VKYHEHTKVGDWCSACEEAWPCVVAQALTDLAWDLERMARNHTDEYQHAILEVAAHILPEGVKS